MNGADITQWRNQLGWSLDEAAQQLGLNLADLVKLEATPVLTEKDSRFVQLLMNGLASTGFSAPSANNINSAVALARRSEAMTAQRKEWFLAWRKRMGLTQERAAQVLGLKAGRTISGYETGSYPIPERVMMMAATYEQNINATR